MTPTKPTYQELVHNLSKLENEIELLRSSKNTGDVNCVRYKKIIDNIVDVVAVIDKKGIIQYISPNIEKLLGWSPLDLIGDSGLKNIHPDDLNAAKNSIHKLITKSNSSGTINIRYKCKSERYKWIEINGKNLLSDPDIKGVLVTVRDITTKKQTIKKLRYALARNKALLAANPDIMFVFDSECRIIDYRANDEKRELYLQPSNFLNKKIDSLLPIELSNLTNKKVQEVLTTGKQAHARYTLKLNNTTQYFESRYVPCGLNEVLAIVRNITELRRSEEIIKEKEFECNHLNDLLRNMTDIMPDMLWAKDLDEKYIFANNSFCRNLLNAKDTNEPIGKTDMFFAKRERESHPQNPTWHTFGEICRDTDAIVLKSGTTGRFDEYGNIKGEFIFLDVIKTPLKNEKGEIIGVVGTGRIVTEQRKSEQKLRESEANLKAIIENSLESIWSIDTNYNIKYVNDIFVKSFHNTFGVLLQKGVNILKSLPTDLQPLWKERYDKAFKNEQSVFTDKIDLGETSLFIEVAMNPIVIDNNVVGASFYGKNITKSKQNEHQIQYQSELRKLLIELSTNFINLPLLKIERAIRNSLELIGTFVGADRSCIFKYDFKNNICRNTHEWCQPNISSHISELQEYPLTNFTNYIKYHKKGELIHFPDTSILEHEQAKLLIENQGIKSMITVPMISNFECIGFVGFDSVKQTHNYTKDEQQLLQVYAQMLVNVEERIIKEQNLIKAKEKAEESEQLKMAFLQNMSHEIRTPMNSIIGFLELLKDSDMTNTEKNYFVDIVNQSGQRLLSTINDIIEISKIEAGQAEVKYSMVNLHEALKFQFDFFGQKCNEKKITFKLSESKFSEDTHIRTDRFKLDGILTNLINNALKFTKEGTIELGNYIDDNMLVFFVKDTGIGIPSDRIEAIFNRFVQADINNTRPYEGSGLGLAIAKAYAKMLNGKIWVESEIGAGSCFYLSLPFDCEIMVKSNELVVEKPLKLLNKQITMLISEDDEYSFKYLETILQNKNITILRAKNGEETIKKVLKNPDISLILMDIKMPLMDGLEATRKIRTFNKEIPIIAQSAYALAGDKEKAFEAGCNDYLSKPIIRQELIEIINKFINVEIEL